MPKNHIPLTYTDRDSDTSLEYRKQLYQAVQNHDVRLVHSIVADAKRALGDVLERNDFDEVFGKMPDHVAGLKGAIEKAEKDFGAPDPWEEDPNREEETS